MRFSFHLWITSTEYFGLCYGRNNLKLWTINPPLHCNTHADALTLICMCHIQMKITWTWIIWYYFYFYFSNEFSSGFWPDYILHCPLFHFVWYNISNNTYGMASFWSGCTPYPGWCTCQVSERSLVQILLHPLYYFHFRIYTGEKILFWIF